MKTMLFFIELDDNNFSVYERLTRLLPPEKQEQIYKIRFNIDKKLSLFSDLFVRYLACKVLNLNNTEVIFYKNDYGKPYLDGFPSFQYNISHTKNAIVIGISNKPIGVDIEKIKPINLKIAERFYCMNELRYILSKEDVLEKLFYKVWTKKEAYIKWIGKGLSLPLTSFDVTDVELRKILKNIEIDEYMLSICSKADFYTEDVYRLTEKQASKILMEFARNIV